MSFGEAFLALPDLFPARRSGEPWGGRSVSLELPGGPYQVSGLSAAQESQVRERFGELCGAPAAAGGTGGVQSRLFAVAAGDFREVDTRGWEYAIDFDHAPRSVRCAGLRIMARLDWSPVLSGSLWTCEDGKGRAEQELFPGIFENFLRVLLAYRLTELGGALLHSAGVVDGGQAFLFLGASGAGKTTLSRLSLAAGRTVLSDDLNALSPLPGGGARVDKLPFTGDVGDRRSGSPAYPLRGLLQLEKGPAAAFRPLSAARAAALLLACSPFVNADPHRRERLAANLSGLARAAPAGVLTFSREGDFWDMLRKSLP
ncbi:MAG TPA: hypothetical protein VOA87_02870 [Thermoanaerobaculia bacterium]|nr:hypothetical protein [Thermoanaerobaculia bacterium]